MGLPYPCGEQELQRGRGGVNVSCVIPTRGNVDLVPILNTLDWCDDVVIWNNAERADEGLYGRYAAIAEVKHDVIVTQDDDLTVSDWPAILRCYEPGVLTVNYPEPWDIPWVARGAVFDRGLPFAAFARYLAVWPDDEFFRRYVCDAVFGLLAREVRAVDFGSVDMEHANEAGRISTSPGWYNDRRPEAQLRCSALLAA